VLEQRLADQRRATGPSSSAAVMLHSLCCCQICRGRKRGTPWTGSDHCHRRGATSAAVGSAERGGRALRIAHSASQLLEDDESSGSRSSSRRRSRGVSLPSSGAGPRARPSRRRSSIDAGRPHQIHRGRNLLVAIAVDSRHPKREASQPELHPPPSPRDAAEVRFNSSTGQEAAPPLHADVIPGCLVGRGRLVATAGRAGRQRVGRGDGGGV
jgi:hypothetical protein